VNLPARKQLEMEVDLHQIGKIKENILNQGRDRNKGLSLKKEKKEEKGKK
jgi:hypothetical protein